MTQELFEKFVFQSKYLNDVEYKLKKCWIDLENDWASLSSC